MSSNNPSYNFLSPFIIGVIEGIIVILALFCFLLARGLDIQHVYLYTGIAVIFIATLLGVGAYYTRKEELQKNDGESKIMKIYQALDIDDNLKQAMVSDTLQENEVWDKEWRESGNATESLSPKIYAYAIVSGFLSGSIIILANNYLMHLPDYSAFLIPFILLGILGFYKYRFSGKNPITGMLLIAVSGIIAAFGAYYAGGLFS